MAADDTGARRSLRSRFATVRVRTTTVAVVVVGVALVVGGIGLVVALRRSLTADVRTAAELRAEDVVRLLEADTDPQSLAVGESDEALIQVIDADGNVVASSANVAGASPVVMLEPGASTTVEDLPLGDEGEQQDILLVADVAVVDGERIVVLVGQSLEEVAESTGLVTGMLLLGLPVLLLVVGFTTWRVVGRALAPVEGIRSEVESISAAELHRRVPEPASGDEIGRLAATMNAMLTRLQKSQARERRFVSDASHELRSPVATIRQHAEVALAHPGRTEAGELAEVVLAEDLRLAQLVEDLLWLARADEHRARTEPVDVDLDDLVLEAGRHLRGATTRVSVDTTEIGAARVVGDAAALRRLVRNLADNALRHARGRIALSVLAENGSVVVRVDDDGPGIPPEDRERVFERFERLDEARARDGGGSGLGLAIAAEVADAHAGTLVVHDSPLGGARFEFTMPAAAQRDA